MKLPRQIFALGSAVVCAALLCLNVFAAEPAETPPAATATGDTNLVATPDFLRNYLQMQEQLHAAQLAIERNRREAADEAAKNAEAVNQRLQQFELKMATQRDAERNQLESTQRLMLYVGGGCVALGFLAMLVAAYFQWRAVGKLTEYSMVSQAAFTANRTLPAPGAGMSNALTEQASGRLYDAIARIEQQIRDLENATHPAPTAGIITIDETVSASSSAASTPRPSQPRLAVLIAKGQSFLDLDQAQEALSVFNDVLTIDPGHTETLVKKGETLERLGRLDDAIRCYDAAIAADANFTVAYLHKGGLFNRMERHDEALKCYEEALRTQEKNQTTT
jgi:tetratricopeptide (TPR) repeat protein